MSETREASPESKYQLLHERADKINVPLEKYTGNIGIPEFPIDVQYADYLINVGREKRVHQLQTEGHPD